MRWAPPTNVTLKNTDTLQKGSSYQKAPKGPKRAQKGPEGPKRSQKYPRVSNRHEWRFPDPRRPKLSKLCTKCWNLSKGLFIPEGSKGPKKSSKRAQNGTVEPKGAQKGSEMSNRDEQWFPDPADQCDVKHADTFQKGSTYQKGLKAPKRAQKWPQMVQKGPKRHRRVQKGQREPQRAQECLNRDE